VAEPVHVARDGQVATIVLDNPGKRNALTKAAWALLGDAVESLARDDGVRCIVMRGAGTEAFAAGADIAEFPAERADAAQARAYGVVVERCVGAIAECRHPTLAMIHGACTGGGLEIATACDLRISGESGRFGIPINRLGHTLGYGELDCLLRLVGPATALEILLEGRIYDAAEALAKGLVNRVVPDARLEAEVLATARRIAAGAPIAARLHKKFVRRLADRAPLTAAERDEAYAACDSADYRAGFAAFIAKRAPVFEGR
jgi:enoyl-CoA hydratase/carnithine racemase